MTLSLKLSLRLRLSVFGIISFQGVQFTSCIPFVDVQELCLRVVVRVLMSASCMSVFYQSAENCS